MKHGAPGYRPPVRLGTGALLGALALCTLLMSAIFFVHIRHGRADGPTAQNRILPGLTLAAVGPHLVITSIRSGAQAARRGILVGDEIMTIDGRSFRSLDQAQAYLIRSRHEEVALALREGGLIRLVTLTRAGE